MENEVEGREKRRLTRCRRKQGRGDGGGEGEESGRGGRSKEDLEEQRHVQEEVEKMEEKMRKEAGGGKGGGRVRTEGGGGGAGGGLTCSTLKNPADCSTLLRDSTSLVLSSGSIPLLTISSRQSQASSLSSSTDMWLSSRPTKLPHTAESQLAVHKWAGQVSGGRTGLTGRWR